MWHVGVLYRAGDLLELLHQKPTKLSSILVDFPIYRGVSTKDIIDLSFIGKWIQRDCEDKLFLTAEGLRLVETNDPVRRLRTQVITLMEILYPPWAVAMVQGRKAFSKYAPPEAVQCFRESGILDLLDEDVIAFWDRIAARYRKDHDRKKVETGRRGERLSYCYERDRIGKSPYWIALDFASAGYDMVSQVSLEDEALLLIEVKASSEEWARAHFHLTRHEWDTLNGDHAAVLHLWSLASKQVAQAVVPVSDITEHIPNDHGSGNWEAVDCPFDAFKPNLIA